MNNRSAIIHLLKTGAGKLGVSISIEEASRFIQYCDELIFWKRIAGITSYKKEEEIVTYMFLDSLAGVPLMKPCSDTMMLDLGTGGGFPGLPMKILEPETGLVLLDSSIKKVRFLENLLKSLSIEGVSVVKGRIEELSRVPAYREKFDIVCARGLAPLRILLELAVPYLKTGGMVMAWKGSAVEKEIREAQSACEIMNVGSAEIFSYILPFAEEQRHIVTLRKIKDTPLQFPRKLKRMKVKEDRRLISEKKAVIERK